MNSKELQTLSQIRETLVNPVTNAAVEQAAVTNPVRELERSLTTLLAHRTEKLKSSFEFEELIKDTISTRINEASFPQLLQALEVIQNGNNRATESFLAPLINNPSFADNARNQESANSQAAAAVYARTDDKKVLQGLVALNQLLDIIKSKQAASDAEDATIVSSDDQNDGSSS